LEGEKTIRGKGDRERRNKGRKRERVDMRNR
jgi:hypothetical protein